MIQPSKIVCVGRNYVAHIRELNNEIPDSMVVFNKPNSAIADTLHSHIDGQTLHYESELAFLVAKGTLSAVGFGLDLTKRDLQTELKEKGLPWERAKSFDGAALFTTLEDGDIIMTGTPSGVGEIRPQERFEGQVLLDDKPIVSTSWVAIP